MKHRRGNDVPRPSTKGEATVLQRAIQKFGHWRRFAAGVAIVIAAIAATIAIALRHQRLAPLRQLVAVFESQAYRTVEGRLSGGFSYRPIAAVMRGRETPPFIPAAAAVMLSGRGDRSAAMLQYGGISRLLLHDWNGALELFNDALRAETRYDNPVTAIAASDNAALLSDVAVAYHAHARHHDQPRSFVVAAEAAQRAWLLEKSPETAWNRALTIESLHLRADAVAAWTDYLAIDGGSGWAPEARERLNRLAAPTTAALWEKEALHLRKAVLSRDDAEVLRIVRAFPHEARTRAENVWLPSWGETGETRELDLCRAVGRALRQSSGESMLADTIAHIDSLVASQRIEIMRGLSSYRAARAAYSKADFTAAAAPMRIAWETLDRTGSPFALVARMYLLRCEAARDDRPVLPAIDEWLAERPPDERRHPALAASVRWVKGSSAFRVGRPQAAIDEWVRAAALLDRLGETNMVALLYRNLSEPYDYIGDSANAWRYRFMALQRAARIGENTPHLLETPRLFASAALTEGMPAVAILCLDRILHAIDGNESSHDLRVTALLLRARAHRALGNTAAAEADVRMARRLIPRVPDASIRAQLFNEPQVVRDRVAVAADAAERRQILADAIDYAAEKGFSIPLGQLYLQQAREAMRAREWDGAEKALNAGIHQLERERIAIYDSEKRATFLTARRELYNTLASLLCSRGEYRRAFDVVERGRARSLLDLVSGTQAPLSSLERIQVALDAYTAIVAYAPVADAVGVWLITRTDVRFFTIGRDQHDVRRLADQFRIALRDGDDASDLGRQLDRLLVQPWYRGVRSMERLVFVPGEVVTGLPFAALHDGRSYLIERHTITIVPSANVLLACITRDRQLRQARDKALIVAPAASANSVRGQAFLAASQAEAADVARQYRNPVVLEGAAATSAAFVERAPFAETIHFAGHAIADRAGPPRLLFAGDDLMHVEDIRALRFGMTRTVMLAACDSAAEHLSANNDGVSSLARAFLAAGVPAVIGSYWQVEDEATSRLSRRFHEVSSRGQDPAAALRAAQLDMIESGDARSRRAGAWAAFALFGGTQTERR